LHNMGHTRKAPVSSERAPQTLGLPWPEESGAGPGRSIWSANDLGRRQSIRHATDSRACQRRHARDSTVRANDGQNHANVFGNQHNRKRFCSSSRESRLVGWVSARVDHISKGEIRWSGRFDISGLRLVQMQVSESVLWVARFC